MVSVVLLHHHCTRASITLTLGPNVFLVCMASLTPSLSASYCAYQTDVSTDNTVAIVGGVVAVVVIVTIALTVVVTVALLRNRSTGR